MRWLPSAMFGLGALWGCATAPKAAAPTTSGIVFIEDDLERANRQAIERRVPLFVDVWAGWCPGCRYMRENVFPDPVLARFASRVVWVAVDLDGPGGAKLQEHFSFDQLPAMLVLDPPSGKALVSTKGTLTAGQVAGVLEQALGSGADRDLEAVRQLDALKESGSLDRCAAEAATLARAHPESSWFGSAVAKGLGCWDSASDGAWRQPAAAALEPLAEQAIGRAEVSADIRSQLYGMVVELREAAGDAPGKREWATRWFAFAQAEASRATTPSGRAAFAWPLIRAAAALGDEALALPALLRTESELPEDGDPPWRLSEVYEDLGRNQEALAACARALERLRGPGQLKVLEREARLHEKLGHPALAVASLQRAIDLEGSLPPSQQRPQQRARFKDRLRQLQSGPVRE